MSHRLEQAASAMAGVLTATSIREMSDRLLHEVGQHVPSFAQGVYLHRPDSRTPSSIEVRGLSTFYAHQYEKHGREHDPVVSTAIATGEVVDSSLIPDDEWEASVAAGGVFREHDMGHLLCAPFQVDGRFGGTLNLARHPDDAEFDEDDRRQMSIVASLFGSGMTSCRRLEKARHDRTVYRNALDHCGTALIITDLEEVERIPNAEAERLLGSVVDPWPVLGPVLDDSLGEAKIRLQTAYGISVDFLVSTTRSKAGSELISLLEPLGSTPPTIPPSIAALLTKREAEVATAVGLGLHDSEVAQLLHVSPHTVKHHLKAVYHKLHVHSRVELVNRLHQR